MMRLTAALLLGLATSAGCAVHAPATADLRLRLEPATVAPGDSVVLVLHNGSSERAGYNLCTSALERRTADGWEDVPLDRICTLELRILEPGGQARYPLLLPALLPPGQYRAATSVERMESRETVRLESGPLQVR